MSIIHHSSFDLLVNVSNFNFNYYRNFLSCTYIIIIYLAYILYKNEKKIRKFI